MEARFQERLDEGKSLLDSMECSLLGIAVGSEVSATRSCTAPPTTATHVCASKRVHCSSRVRLV